MGERKKYYKDIALIRVLACFAVFLYHMNILKGGYLAVCTFFVLSGYLSCVSLFKKGKFSFKEYYFHKLLYIYLPLVIVVFLSITIVSLFPNINWFNLKPETTSVLFGYNNFWQLSANLNYFARHIDSPFMHLWYIAIILQFDLVFPIIFLGMRKISDKINKNIAHCITIILAFLSFLFFYKTSLDGNRMITYYHTFARSFSLLFGGALGFIHSYYGSIIPSFLKKKVVSRILFYSYLLIMVVAFILVDANSSYFSFSMMFVTFITCRLIDYGTLFSEGNLSILERCVKSIAGVSYEIYLIQYPVLFLFQYIEVAQVLKMAGIFILTVVLSYILHFSLNFRNKAKKKLRYILFIILVSISLYGGYLYCTSKDYTNDIKELELKLSRNEELMRKRQEEYMRCLKEEQANWTNTLKNLEDGEKELEDIVSNLTVVGIGDSVMLGAINNLYEKFPNGYFDAKVSRTAWVANGILQELASNGRMGEPIILNLGANGDCPDSCKQEIMDTIGNRQVFWINVTNNKELNHNLVDFASHYSNLHIIDWQSISYGHSEYFVADGIHLTEMGTEIFTETIYSSIYDFYLQKYRSEKEKIIKEHNSVVHDKISFIGNDILLNAFGYLQESFQNAEFIINDQFNYESLVLEIEKRKKEETLAKKIVFAFDKNIDLSKSEYQSLIKLCDNCDIYILVTTEEVITFDMENVKILNFYSEIVSHKNYLMADKVHLTEEGNKALNKMLNDNING